MITPPFKRVRGPGRAAVGLEWHFAQRRAQDSGTVEPAMHSRAPGPTWLSAALRRRGLDDGEPHLKTGIAWLGLDLNVPVVAAHDDPVADVEAEPCALTDILGGKEWLEDAPPQFGADSRAGIAD